MSFPGFPPGLPRLPPGTRHLLSAEAREAIALTAVAGRPAATRAAERHEARWTVDAIDAAFARGSQRHRGTAPHGKGRSVTDEIIPDAKPRTDDLTMLEAAGLRLDAAIAHFELAGDLATLSPADFGNAEAEYFAAQGAYRNILQKIIGADPDVVLRRLAR
jgi:hypothetical protein